MEQVLQGIPKTQCDIIVAGATEEHLRIIEEVLARLDQYAMTLNKAKCAFFKSQTAEASQMELDNGLFEVKRLIVSELVLTHLTPDRPLVLSCDASAYGGWGRVVHNGPGGERP